MYLIQSEDEDARRDDVHLLIAVGMAGAMSARLGLTPINRMSDVNRGLRANTAYAIPTRVARPKSADKQIDSLIPILSITNPRISVESEMHTPNKP